ncbi:MAG: DUF3306 domain-containing protein [Pseudomonadota bacterium]
MSTRDREEGFLSRWSRRKLEPEPEPEGVEAPVAAEPSEAAPEPEKTEAEVLEELGLPEPESLGKGDDFSAFMKEAVPEQLRRRALRRLWLTDPVLANLDEMVDYGEDFTDAATVVANLTTAYKVGRGFKPDPAEEVPEEAEAEVAETEATLEAEEVEPAPEPEIQQEEPVALAEAGPPEPAPAPQPDPQPEAPPQYARPRRMRFVSGAD